MTMQFKCGCCGHVEEVTQWGAVGSADVSNDGNPPDGWRTIYTIIEKHNGDGRTATRSGEIVQSCADCNAQMSVDEHLEAEHEARKARMWAPS